MYFGKSRLILSFRKRDARANCNLSWRSNRTSAFIAKLIEYLYGRRSSLNKVRLTLSQFCWKFLIQLGSRYRWLGHSDANPAYSGRWQRGWGSSTLIMSIPPSLRLAMPLHHSSLTLLCWLGQYSPSPSASFPALRPAIMRVPARTCELTTTNTHTYM